VNQAFERRFFADQGALGALVRIGRVAQTPYRIVGVVHDAVVNEIGEAGEAYFYVPFWRRPMGELTFLVQTSGDASALAAPVRDVLARVNPGLEPARVTTMQEYIAYSASTYRATASLAALLGLIGLILTALGVYGVVAYRMSRRTREIGIRIALGAHPPDVLRLVMREGAQVAAAGIVLGLPIALGATRLLSSLLFRVSAWDAWSFAAAAVALAAALCAATAVPAWRATRLSPSIALRDR
jgi:putative ABC transport system permease protein